MTHPQVSDWEIVEEALNRASLPRRGNEPGWKHREDVDAALARLRAREQELQEAANEKHRVLWRRWQDAEARVQELEAALRELEAAYLSMPEGER